jgi:hypothetical protein
MVADSQTSVSAPRSADLMARRSGDFTTSRTAGGPDCPNCDRTGPGLGGCGAYSQRPPPAGQLAGEQDVRQLARLVSAQAVVAAGHVQVVNNDGRAPRRDCRAGGRDDPAPRGRQAVLEEHGQQERGQVVHLEGQLVTVSGDGTPGTGDQPGVVDQDINPGMPGLQPAARPRT